MTATLPSSAPFAFGLRSVGIVLRDELEDFLEVSDCCPRSGLCLVYYLL
jgi:hypothetical protein